MAEFEYNSSEELKRHNAAVFALEQEKKAQRPNTELERLKAQLDSYIAKHNSTVGVIAEAKKHQRDEGYQLKLSGDIVLILEKIKSELR